MPNQIYNILSLKIQMSAQSSLLQVIPESQLNQIREKLTNTLNEPLLNPINQLLLKRTKPLPNRLKPRNYS